MLVECGLARLTTRDGSEFTFRPSFARIAGLGSPHEIVQIFAGLHGPNAATDATYVLACLCDQEDPTPLIGCTDLTDGAEPVKRPGLMPESEQIIIAQHLMRHGIVGKARPGDASGKFSDRFEAAEYIAAARVHLGLSSADAEALSMTEFQTMMAMKFPDTAKRERDIPSREQYDAAMQAINKARRG